MHALIRVDAYRRCNRDRRERVLLPRALQLGRLIHQLKQFLVRVV